MAGQEGCYRTAQGLSSGSGSFFPVRTGMCKSRSERAYGRWPRRRSADLWPAPSGSAQPVLVASRRGDVRAAVGSLGVCGFACRPEVGAPSRCTTTARSSTRFRGPLGPLCGSEDRRSQPPGTRAGSVRVREQEAEGRDEDGHQQAHGAEQEPHLGRRARPALRSCAATALASSRTSPTSASSLPSCSSNRWLISRMNG